MIATVEDAARHLAMHTTLSQDTARACFLVAWQLTTDMKASIDLVCTVHAQCGRDTFGALAALLAPRRADAEPPLSAGQITRITTRLVELLYPAAYRAGVNAVLQAGIAEPGTLPTSDRVTAEIIRYELASAATYRELGHPVGYFYPGGPVPDWPAESYADDPVR